MRHACMVIPVLLIGLFCARSYATAENGISITASLWPYNSLCDLPEPAAPAKQFRAEKDTTISISRCLGLKKEWGKPTAVRIHIVNSGNAKTEVTLKGLATILLRKSAGTTSTALGIQLWQPSPFGGEPTVGIANKFVGSLGLIIPPRSEIDLVVLFKNAVEGDSVIIGEGKPARISK